MSNFGGSRAASTAMQLLLALLFAICGANAVELVGEISFSEIDPDVCRQVLDPSATMVAFTAPYKGRGSLKVDWGDFRTNTYFSLVNEGLSYSLDHAYTQPGIYTVRATATVMTNSYEEGTKKEMTAVIEIVDSCGASNSNRGIDLGNSDKGASLGVPGKEENVLHINPIRPTICRKSGSDESIFTALSTSPGFLKLRIDWGDESKNYNIGMNVKPETHYEFSHTYENEGAYQVVAKGSVRRLSEDGSRWEFIESEMTSIINVHPECAGLPSVVDEPEDEDLTSNGNGVKVEKVNDLTVDRARSSNSDDYSTQLDDQVEESGLAENEPSTVTYGKVPSISKTKEESEKNFQDSDASTHPQGRTSVLCSEKVKKGTDPARLDGTVVTFYYKVEASTEDPSDFMGPLQSQLMEEVALKELDCNKERNLLSNTSKGRRLETVGISAKPEDELLPSLSCDPKVSPTNTCYVFKGRIAVVHDENDDKKTILYDFNKSIKQVFKKGNLEALDTVDRVKYLGSTPPPSLYSSPTKEPESTSEKESSSSLQSETDILEGTTEENSNSTAVGVSLAATFLLLGGLLLKQRRRNQQEKAEDYEEKMGEGLDEIIPNDLEKIGTFDTVSIREVSSRCEEHDSFHLGSFHYTKDGKRYLSDYCGECLEVARKTQLPLGEAFDVSDIPWDRLPDQLDTIFENSASV